MIAFIKGTVASYTADSVVIDHGGMGWQIAYPHTDELHLNEEITVYTYLHYSDMDLSLYGFSSPQEKELFLRLISVKGLGPRTAMNMLSKASADNIITAIETGNVALLKKMPGIGAKTASQIVLDLKGKLVAVETNKKTADKTQSYSQEIQDALEGLKNLGYRQADLGSAANIMAEKPGLSTAEYLRMGLRYLASHSNS